jgi:hypothetical protein
MVSPFMGLLLIALFLAFGRPVALLAAGGSEDLAAMGLVYLRITVFAAPLIFVLSVNSDALRNEGLVMFMAAMSLLVSLSNMAFNYVLIGLLDMGVAGSAYGTAMAQALALAIIFAFRVFGDTRAAARQRCGTIRRSSGWGRILALGAPQSLNFLGLALGSGAIIAALQWVEAPDYDATVSAYGIVTRLITFAFLPLLGLAHAMQTITGNNYGAGAFHRSDASLRTAVIAAFGYCLALQIGMTVFAEPIGCGLRLGPDRHRRGRAHPAGDLGRVLRRRSAHDDRHAFPGHRRRGPRGDPGAFQALSLRHAADIRVGGVGGRVRHLARSAGRGGPAGRADGPRPGTGRTGAVPALGSLHQGSGGAGMTRDLPRSRRRSRKRNNCVPPSPNRARRSATRRRWSGSRSGTASATGTRFMPQMRDRPPQGWTVGGRVTGRYLSQPFAATVLAADQFRPGWFRLVLDLDAAVDVVRFDSFSNLRKRIRVEVGPAGHSKERTSDGIPHVELDP